MKTPKVVYVGILLSFLLSGCMPDSFTKFKEEPAKKKQEAAAPVVEKVPESVDFSKITVPTGLAYSDTPADLESQIFIFEVGKKIDPDAEPFSEFGPCGIRPVVDGDLASTFCKGIFAENTPEASEFRVMIEDLKFTFWLVQPDLDSTPAACDAATNGSGPALPSGMSLDVAGGYFSGTPSAITSDTTPGPNYGLPYKVGIKMRFLNETFPGSGIVTYQSICKTVKIAAYAVPNSRDFNYQQSTTVKLDLQDFVGQGSIAAFSIGDSVSSLDKDGAVAGTGTVIFVDTTHRSIIVTKLTGDFYKDGTVDDNSSYLGPEATIKKVTNVFQTSTTPGDINVGPLGLPPIVASPGPYLNPTLGPENGVRFFTDFNSRPPSLSFSRTTGVFNGYIETEIQEAPLTVYAINPLWSGGLFSFFPDVVNSATGAWVGTVKFGDLGTTNVASVTENFEVTDPALDGSYADQYLLEVNDARLFNVGDFVSTNSCGTGATDSQEMTVGRVLAKVEHNIPALSYILVQYIRGCAFKNYESIDNSFPYKSPKATVYRAVPNSFVIRTTTDVSSWTNYIDGDSSYHISAENGAKGIVNMVQNGSNVADGTEFGLGIHYYIFVRATSPVDIASDGDTTVNNELQNYFSTTSDAGLAHTKRRSNLIGNCERYVGCGSVATILDIFSSTIELDILLSLNNTDISTGDTFSTTDLNSTLPLIYPLDSDGGNHYEAFGDIIDGSNKERVVAVLNKGFLRTAHSIDDENPYPAPPTPIGIGAVTYVPAFYLKKGNFYEFPFFLDKGIGTSTYSLTPVTAPPGMVFDPATGSIITDNVNNSENLTRTEYQVEASNGAGKTTFKAAFEILEYFELQAFTSDNNRNTSVVLHRAGKGNQLAPCGMFEAQMGVGTCTAGSGRNRTECENSGGTWNLNNDTLCYLEIGEEDLWFNGLKLKLEVSGAQCEFVAHEPYTMYKFRPGTTDVATTDIYKHNNFSACNTTLIGSAAGTLAAPTNEYTRDAAGTNGIDSPRDMCLRENGGFDYKDVFRELLLEDKDGPNCDEGAVQIVEYVWSLNGFECYEGPAPYGTAGLTADTTAASCIANNMGCTTPATNCSGANAAACATQTDCEGDSGTWEFQGQHNDCSYSGGVPCSIAAGRAEMKDCTRSAPADTDQVACGGNYGHCVASSFKGINGSSGGLDADTKKENGAMISNLIASDGTITYDYYSAYSQEDITANNQRNERIEGNNTILSNYIGENNCAEPIAANPYVYDVGGLISSANNPGNSFMGFNATFKTHPLYTYECRNASGDSRGIIRVLVREWNQDFQTKLGFKEIDKSNPGAVAVFGDLLEGGLNDYGDIDSMATPTNNKCSGAPTYNFAPMPVLSPVLPPSYPNHKL
ncbi:MAG: hypothetical protein EP319_01575 [Deltaproteobacteria bacterium]|nr:MAG: hypothetical protein EP319_01575 [Deltaproteobacteria bacterium]